ncbi:MAG: ABC transporter permease subunit [Planctomycetota bacterium]
MSTQLPGNENTRSRKRVPLPLLLAVPLVLFAASCILYLFSGTGSFLDSFFTRTTTALLLCCLLFTTLYRVARQLLGRGGQMSAVARTVLAESMATRAAPAFLVVLFIALCALTIPHQEEAPARYMVQTYLGYAFSITSIFAGTLSLLLACKTLSREIEEKLIETLAVKPVSRIRYLAGKWLGLVILNAIMLSVAMTVIYLFTVHHIGARPGLDAMDSEIIEKEILTAREFVPAQPYPALAKQVELQLEKLKKEKPGTLYRLGKKEAARKNLPSLDESDITLLGIEQARKRLKKLAPRRWRSLGPGRSRGFVFEGLGHLRDSKAPLKLRYRIAAQPGGEAGPARLSVFTGEREELREFNTLESGYLDLDPGSIDAEGRLILGLKNPPDAPGTVIFNSIRGLEVLRSRASFEGNLLRAFLAVWVKLSFLSMLGLLCSSFLGFPVAVLFCAMILLGATTSPFLLDVADMSHNPDNLGGFFENFATSTTTIVAKSLGRYSEFNPGMQLVDGRLFSWRELGRCFLWIGIVWTGISGSLAAYAYSRRELARVQV